MFFGFFKLSSSATNENGLAITELAAVLPVLLMILVGIVDAGLALDSYFRLTRVAYEGSRYGIAIPGLAEGEYDEERIGSEFEYSHVELHDRIVLILEDYGFERESADIVTSYGEVEGVDDVVTVSVSVKHQPILPILIFEGREDFDLNIVVEAPYLYVKD